MALQSNCRWRPHPWHGLETSPESPGLVYASIGITPFDMIPYEVKPVSNEKTGDREAAIQGYQTSSSHLLNGHT